MRIVDEWSRNKMKVTVFHMNGRYSVKLEQDLFEQTYKFRDGQFNEVQTLKNKMDDAFYTHCEQIFSSMQDNRKELLTVSDEEDNFPVII